MRFSNIALPAVFSAFIAQAIGAETITVTDLTVRDIDSAIYATEFTIQPGSIDCSGSTDFSSAIVCGDSAYRFEIQRNSLSDYNLTIYKQTGPAVGIYEEQELSLICRAGGSAASDYVCNDFSNVTYTLQ